MELSGDEKRIQALFSELRVIDERTAPRFSVLVNRGATEKNQPRSRFKLSLAWTALALCAIAALAWWSVERLRQPLSSPVASVTPRTTANGSSTRSSQTSKTPSLSVPQPNSAKAPSDRVVHVELLARRLAARRHAEMVAANKRALADAQAISNWSSPTDTLLSSASGEVLTNLPQLNQSATQMKSFLTKSPD